jgi:hypothetical protein
MNAIERKLHQHSLEQDGLDRELRREAKDLDEEVGKAKAAAKVELSKALSRKE